jgi:hypothetical protein
VIVSVEITPESVKFLRKLKRQTGASSYEALLNDAITLMGWAARQRQEGRVVASLSEASNGYRELQMTSLEHAARFVERIDAAADDVMDIEEREFVEPPRLARVNGE